jgi:thiamine pyrophosphate-dependent acetolactate synthase large subunit-like protein
MVSIDDVLKAFAPHRGDAIVISGRATRQWEKVSTLRDLDLPLGDPAMGGHASFALGLAMAQPHRKIVLFDSEGDIQMNLGVLAMIAEQKPGNFYHLLLDNECYATTGGQPVPNAKAMAYDVIAKGCGYPSAHAFTSLESFTVSIGRILTEPGPVMVAMKVAPDIQNVPIGQRTPRSTRTRDQAVADLRKTLNISN